MNKIKVLVGEKPFVYSGELVEETNDFLIIHDTQTDSNVKIYKRNITAEWRD